MKSDNYRTGRTKDTTGEKTVFSNHFNTGDKTMKKSEKKATKKAGKKAESKGKRITLKDKIQGKSLFSNVKTHYSAPLTASYFRKVSAEVTAKAKDSADFTLDSHKAQQEMKVTEYDSPKKRRQDAIEYVKKALPKITAGKTIKWKGRNADRKSGNLNTLSKYFFSNVKSTCTQDCNVWNIFSLTSMSEKAEGK